MFCHISNLVCVCLLIFCSPRPEQDEDVLEFDQIAGTAPAAEEEPSDDADLIITDRAVARNEKCPYTLKLVRAVRPHMGQHSALGELLQQPDSLLVIRCGHVLASALASACGCPA